MDPNRNTVAIVGMACRLPGGVTSPEALWRLLVSRTDAISEIPGSRWDRDRFFQSRREGAEPGLSYVWSAGVVENLDEFDAAFFGISPREAEQIDPQQRLMLELSWEALENARIVPSSLAGTSCGVFVGISLNDYAHMREPDPASINAYYMTGGALGVAANRVSYFLNVKGPSLAVDTACSSSLVALHLACQSLRAGESSAAIIGGVNALLSPIPFVGFCGSGLLSTFGRCRAFDAGAGGYVRAEGGVVFVLKRLDEALAAGDTVHAVILGSGVNSDGRTQGLSLPNDEAQEALLRRVYGQSGVHPSSLCYLEAHGTGTAAGDPLELQAVGRFFGPLRPRGDPLLVGSIKTNIGHLESGAGLAGVLKAVLVLEHRQVPPNLHFDRPNPSIPFETLNLSVASQLVDLSGSGPLLAGVNSFGFGGTNAHAILSTGPTTAPVRTESVEEPMVPLYLSARCPGALGELAGQVADRIEAAGPAGYYDIARAAVFDRELHDHRAVVWGGSPTEIVARLRKIGAGSASAGSEVGSPAPGAGKVVLAFSGNGGQWPGMGLDLLDREPVYADAFRKFDAAFAAESGWSVEEELRRPRESSRMARTEVAQPCLVAAQLGLAALLASWGLRPGAVVGHSVGEISAAHAAGAFVTEQVARLVHKRSTAQEKCRGLGRMAAAGLSVEEIQEWLVPSCERLQVACVNSPRSVTVAGPLPDLEDLERRLQLAGRSCRLLELDYPFHHSMLDPLRDDLLAELGTIEARPLRVPMVSTVTGAPVAPEELGAEYWWRNVRQRVLFGPAIDLLVRDGHAVFVEVGPHPVLLAYLREALSGRSIRGEVMAVMNRDSDTAQLLRSARSRLHVSADAVDRHREFPRPGRSVALPTYPWQRERHWHAPTRESARLYDGSEEHPLLGVRLREGVPVWEARIDPSRPSYLGDHRLGDQVVFPAAGYVEMALAAASIQYPAPGQFVEELEIRQALPLDPAPSRLVRFSLSADDGRFVVESRPRLSTDDWTIHAVGRLGALTDGPTPASRPALSGGVTAPDEQHYALAASVGLVYGPAFQAVAAASVEGASVFAPLARSEAVDLGAPGYLVHPVAIDAALQLAVHVAPPEGPPGWAPDPADHGPVAYVPVHLGRIRRHASGRPGACTLTLDRVSARSVVISASVVDDTGRVLLEMSRCRLQAARLGTRPGDSPLRLETVIRPAQRHRGRVSPVPAVEQVVEAVRRTVTSTGLRYRRAEYLDGGSTAVAAAILGFCHEALSGLWPDGPATIEQLEASAGLDPAQRSFLGELLHELRSAGLASCADGIWSLTGHSDLPPAIEVWRRLVADHPAHGLDSLQLVRTGIHLRQILGGTIGEADLARAGSGDGSVEPVSDLDPAAAVLNCAIVEGLDEVVRLTPRSHRLRVLDLGARGTRLAGVIERAPEAHVQVVLAALDPAELVTLRQAASTVPGMTAVLFDTGAAGSRELAPASFDVVVAADSLHRCPDARAALSSLHALLAPGGLLLVGEQAPDLWQRFVAGRAPSWWLPGTGRPAPRRSAARAWEEGVAAAGFAAVRTISEDGGAGDAGAFVVTACKDRAVAEIPVERDGAQRPDPVLVLAGAEGSSAALAASLARRLERSGCTVFTAAAGRAFARTGETGFTVDPCDEDGLVSLLLALEGSTAPATVVSLLGCDCTPEPPPGQLLDGSSRLLFGLACLARAIERVRSGPLPRLVVVTSGALPPPEPDAGPVSRPSRASAWGLARVIASEQPRLPVTRIDLSGGPDELLAESLADEILEPDDEDEILLSGTTRRVPRTVVVPDGPRAAETSPENAVLRFSTPGPFSHLHWYEVPRVAPGAGQVEIRVEAAGLNFRDIMWAMGLLSDEALEDGLAGPTLGLEGAGVVERVGAGVTDLTPGDPVMFFGPASFARYALAPAGSVTRLPDGLSFQEAATIPCAFFTAYYSLSYQAGLERGETVLIHGGAGGVGLAAIQYAGLVGAKIVATAGTREKREFLTALGVDHVVDSRSDAFAERVMEATGGRGVDVVLNSLAGEAIRQNLAILRPFGRFVELGKRDFQVNTRMGLRALRRNITFFAVDADQVLQHRPGVGRRLFAELVTLIEEGKLRPLMHTVFRQAAAAEAFRHMQASRHLGKIVVTLDGAGVQRVPCARAPVARARVPAGTCLISGGLGGLGLKIASWLVERGARAVVLMGRHGPKTDDVIQAIARLERSAVVRVVECDVTDAAAVAAAVAECGRSLPPLEGIVHAAMVLEDASLANLSREALGRVLAPKMVGARNLHELSLGHPVRLFALLSSATTFFGNPGQAAYVAANAYLEALARARVRSGLPGLAICPGGVTDVGVLAGEPDLRRKMKERLGDLGLTADEVVTALDEALAGSRAVVAVTRQDFRRLSRSLPAVLGSPRMQAFRGFLLLPSKVESGGAGLAESLSGLSDAQRREAVFDEIRQSVCEVMQWPAERIPEDRPISEMGLDSLMATELRSALERRLGVAVPRGVVGPSSTLASLSSSVERLLQRPERPGDAPGL